VQLRDALQRRALPAIEDDVPCILRLVSISRQNDSNLTGSSSREIVPATISVLVKAQGDPALLFLRHVPGELKSLLVHGHPRVMAEEHVLEGLHGATIQGSIPMIGHAMVESISRVIDIELGIGGRDAWSWEKGSSSMGESTMELEDIWPSAIID
jgi:hypothetical protein